MFLMLERLIRARYKRSRKYLKPRSDLEEKWHARAGHLAHKALQKLVNHVRNMKINKLIRIICEFCAQAYARQVISRRLTKRKSAQLFWRILWDLFDYPNSYNSSS